jgi:hypothetical protein
MVGLGVLAVTCLADGGALAAKAARAFIAFLARPSAQDTFAAVGMDSRE